MLCVCLATLLLGGGLGTALVAAAALAVCPRRWLWWPPKQKEQREEAPPDDYQVTQLVRNTLQWQRRSKRKELPKERGGKEEATLGKAWNRMQKLQPSVWEHYIPP